MSSGRWCLFLSFVDNDGDDDNNGKGAEDEPVKIDFLGTKRESDVKLEDLDDKADVKRVKEDGEILLNSNPFSKFFSWQLQQIA